MQVKRGTLRQDQAGEWWLEVGFGRNLPATIAATGFGFELHVYTGPTSDQTSMKPPTQRVEANPVIPANFGPRTVDQLPPKARQVWAMAQDPVFQDYAARTAGIAPSNIQDAVVFALDFALKKCGARVPADFTQDAVIERLDALVAYMGVQ